MNDWIVIFWKSTLTFLLLMVVARLIGRKLLSQMTYFDFVSAIVIGTIGGAFMTDNIHGVPVTLGIVLFAIYTLVTDYTVLLSLPARKLIEGEPVIVIQNGKILENNMKRVRYNLNDLEMQMRDKGVFDFSAVEFAILESNGTLSVLKKSQDLPLTPKDFKMNTQYKGMATELIKDGQILEENLKQNNLSFKWLFNQLQEKQIDNIDNVTYMNLNTNGSIYIDMKQDNLDYIQKVED